MDNETLDQIHFIAYNVVAFIIIAIGILGNVLSLIVLTRPNMKVRITPLQEVTAVRAYYY